MFWISVGQFRIMTVELYQDRKMVIRHARDGKQKIKSFAIPTGFIADLSDEPRYKSERPSDLSAIAWIKKEGIRPMSREDILILSTTVAQGLGAVDTGKFGGSIWTLKKVDYSERGGVSLEKVIGFLKNLI